jgi:acyl-homoserine-lactone acylase
MVSPHPRRIAVALTTLAAAALLSAPSRAPVAGNEILWDRYGVPHIFAANAERLAYGFGYAQMQNHANLLLQLYGQARGRAAEYWGKSHLESDRLVRRLEVPLRAEEWYREQSPSFKRYLDGFAAGINAYAREHPASIPDSLKVVLPITGADVLAHGQRVINIMFVSSPGALDAQIRRWRSRAASASPGGGIDDLAEPAAPIGGSNAWAVAPAHSASGKALLLANPHLPWGDLFTWIEAQLTSPEIDIYGATLLGSPVIAIGFNDYLGWTHTVNTHDGVDLYEIPLAAGGDAYRFDSADRPFDLQVDTIKIKDAGGMRSEVMRTKHSVHGPVVAEAGGKALALRIVGLDRPGGAEEWWEMGRAKNLAEFERALRRLQIPMFTVMYADRDGRIMHLYNALVPERVGGDWTSWLGIIPGDSSGSLWTHTLSYEALPKLRDPSTGWLQNANDPPWYTTIPLAQSIDPSEYPVYNSPRGMALRPQHSAKLVGAEGKMSFDDLVRRKHETHLELADRLLDDLGSAVRASANDRAKQAMAVLDRWDRATDAESRGAVLFATWWRELGRRAPGSPYATPWSAARPLETPDGLADPAAAVAALEAAATVVEGRYGALDVAWGTVHRLRRDGLDLPGNGGGGSLGIFRVIEYATDDTTARTDAADFGDSFVAAVEFSTPVRAQALVGYGNASQPGSPHRTDQLSFLSKKELRPVWRTRAEIEKNLESRKAY